MVYVVAFAGFEIREVLDGTEVKGERRSEEARPRDKAAATAPLRDAVASKRSPPDRVRSKTVHFVLPLFNRLSTFDRFVHNYETVCLQQGADNDGRQPVTLTVVPFGRETADRAVAAANQLMAKYAAARVTVVPAAADDGPFARALALDRGARSVALGPDDDGDGDRLLLFVDVDMLWTASLLDRVRLNTVRGRSAYFPIVYSEYDPVVVYGRPTSPNHFLVNQDTGYWRQYGFGIVSVYRSDLAAAGGLDTAIRGWGNEDVDLFEKFVHARPTAVFRAADPDLVHVYHPVECDPRLAEPKATMCSNTRFETYGNVDQFANIIYKNRRALYEFAERQTNKSTTAAAGSSPPPPPRIG